MDHEVVRIVKKCERNHHEGASGGSWFWTINEQIDQIHNRADLVSLKQGNAITTP